MIGLESSLIELKSERTMLDIQAIGLRRRLGMASSRRAQADDLLDLEERQRRLDERIARIEGGDLKAGVEEMVNESRGISAELEELRNHIVGTLRSLREPLRARARLADRQRELAARTRAATGRDNSYAAYLDTALFRASEFDETLGAVIEALRRERIVA